MWKDSSDGHGGLVLDFEELLSASAAETLRLEAVDAISLAASAGDDPRSFNGVIYTGGVMTPKLDVKSKYQGPVVVLIDGIEYGDDIPVHHYHDEERPVGHVTDISDDGSQISVSATFSIDNEDSREIIDGREKGFPWKPSIGLKLLDYHVVPQGQTLRANGREFVGPILAVTRAILKEIGIVTMPGDAAVAPIALAQDGSTQGSISMSFEDWIASLGLDMASLKDEAVAALRKQYDAEQAGSDASAEDSDEEDIAESADGEGDDAMEDKPDEKAQAKASKKKTAKGNHIHESLQATRAALAKETDRASKIRKLSAKFGDPELVIGGEKVTLSAHAIASGWTLEKTELQARRNQDVEKKRSARPIGPGIHSTSRAERGSLQAMQGAMMLRAGMALDDKIFESNRIKHRLPEFLRLNINDPVRQRAMDNAQEFRGMSMMETCQAACEMNGISYRRGDKLETLKAALSTGTVSELFGATIGAKMLRSYAEVADFTEGWTQSDENPDLEAHVRIRMEGLGNLDHNPIGKKANHATRSTKNEYAAVNRFAKQMNIDEADFLGDNFGKLKDSPADFGRAAGRVVPDLVAAVLLANANLNQTGRALFNATDLSNATGSPLSRATLSAAIARLAKRKDGSATIQLPPTHLLVPPDLMDLAIQLLTSVVISNDAGVGEKNVLYSYGIKPISEGRLANGLDDPISGNFLAGSLTTTYLVSAEANTILITYLEGAGRVPVVRTTELTNGEFGLNIDCRHYAGANAMDFRGFVRNQA